MSTDQRLATLAKVREILPDVDAAQATAIAAWAVSGSMPLDPVALAAAAERLAKVRGQNWSNREVANECRGMTAEVLDAYFAAAHRS
ncbi:hypothetical protein GCM10027258_79470 [Amycolatopsis stemonae]